MERKQTCQIFHHYSRVEIASCSVCSPPELSLILQLLFPRRMRVHGEQPSKTLLVPPTPPKFDGGGNNDIDNDKTPMDVDENVINSSSTSVTFSSVSTAAFTSESPFMPWNTNATALFKDKDVDKNMSDEGKVLTEL